MQPTQDQLNKTYANDAAMGLPQGATAKQIGLESGFNATAVSPAGAMGYAQVTEPTLDSVEKMVGRDLDPGNFDDSLLIQKTVMTQNLQHFGNVPDALRAYNSGWDKSKWNNAETNNYVATLGADGAPVAAGDPTVVDLSRSPKLQSQQTALSKQLAMASAAAGNFKDAALRTMADGSQLDQTQGLNDTSLVEQASNEGGAQVASTTHEADAGEAFIQAAKWNTITGRIADWAMKEEPVNGWKMSDDQKAAVAAVPGVWGNDELRQYVEGARSDAEYARRMSNAQYRADFEERANNTHGVAGVVNTGTQLAVGLSDPVMLVATMGAGAAVNTARAAFVAGEASKVAQFAGAAAGGAAGNMLADAVTTKMNNGQINWPELFQQGLVGAAMGAAGHAFSFGKGTGAKTDTPEVDATADHAGNTAVDAAHSQVETAGIKPGSDDTLAGTFGNDVHEFPTTKATDAPAREGVSSVDDNSGLGDAMAKVEQDRVQAEAEAAAKVQAPQEEPAAMTAEDMEARLGYKPEATIDNPAYKDLHDSGIVTELRTADDLKKVSSFMEKHGEELPADAKAVYIPQEDRVFTIRDRMTAEDLKDPTGLIMHEVGVHYGLERSIGTENHLKLMDSLERSTDPKVREAFKSVPSDTPAHIRTEEALGYLVEKHPNLPLVQRAISSIRNWLREKVPIFKNMDVSANDAIRYVQGSLKNVREKGRLSANLTFPYVWHGSAVKGIDSLKTKYIGTGEGNQSFGHGHYVTSEKGTALDYRNKEAQRRGLNPDDGGLYRLKVNTTRSNMLKWEAPVRDQALASKLKGDLAPIGNETGRQYHSRLAAEHGQAGLADKLDAAGVHGVEYETGRTRGSRDTNSNFVLFHDRHLDIAARYSRTGIEPVRDDVELGSLAQSFKTDIDNWKDVLPQETAKLRNFAKAYYDKVRGHKALEATAGLLDTVGMKLGRSENKGVRKWASDLGEDATGNNRQHASSAAIDKVRYASGWRTPMVEALNRYLPELMTSEEKAKWSMGVLGNDGEKRVGKLVAEERLRRRAAVLSGQTYESQAHPLVKQLAGITDGMWKDMTEQGKAVGEPLSTAIQSKGYVGHTPYSWDWKALQDAYTNNVEKFNSFKSVLHQQYVAKVLNPALEKFNAVGPRLPGEMSALTERVTEQAKNLTDRYLTQVMRDPDSRLQGSDDHFGSVAADLLTEKWHGGKVTKVMAADFKSALKDIINDRTRTEFDLLAQGGDGTRMLDFVDTDLGRMVEQNTSSFGGKVAMAQRGLVDPAHTTALKDALMASGASHEEIKGIDFLMRSLTDNLDNKEFALAKMLQTGAHFSMMGKLGFNALADSASIIASSGMGAFLKTMSNVFGKNGSALMEQLKLSHSSALGLDHRLHTKQTTKGVMNPDSWLAEGSKFQRGLAAASGMVGKLSGMHYVSERLHNAYLPVMIEDVLKTIRSGEGISPARMADMGLTNDRVARIKEQLESFDANRKPGDAVNWDKWDDQGAADDLISATHRAAGQAMQRSYIGETPMWMSEGNFAKMLGQFKSFGVTAAEKQFARNAFIGDSQAAVGFGMSTLWGGMLYYAKMQANTVGMNDKQKEKYMTEHMSGMELASGVMVMVNQSGLLPDSIDAANAIFGGQTQRTGSPVAAIGYLENLIGAAKATGSQGRAALGLNSTPENWASDFRKQLRILPGGNTVFGTALSNEVNSDAK